MTEAAAEASEQEVAISPVGIIESPYREKFSVPRQSGLASNVSSRIRILPPYDTEDAFRGIGEFSHLWLIFGFSLIEDHSFRPLVRPRASAATPESGCSPQGARSVRTHSASRR